MRNCAVIRILVCASWLLVRVATAQAVVQIDWVTVGHPGNECEQQAMKRHGCVGGVAGRYRIAKYETSNAEYAEFLNAVAATDTHALYHPFMGKVQEMLGGIARSGDPGSYSYRSVAGREQLPVNWVSFWDAIRFINWLHNGQPEGAQDNSTTEDGAYTLTLTGVAEGSVVRNGEATTFLPSENEWYKAAYYRERDDATELFVPNSWYWRYPTSSDTQTVCALPGATSNQANCQRVVGDLTARGSFAGSASSSGTFDQGGNVEEWIETAFGEKRGIRGGSYRDKLIRMGTRGRGALEPDREGPVRGFRVASPAADAAVVGEGTGAKELPVASLSVDETEVGALFAAPNRWQDPCTRAMEDVESPPNARSQVSWRIHWEKATRLLRKGVEAGHLPSIHYMLSFSDSELKKLAMRAVEDREVLKSALFEAGFPLASIPIPEDAHFLGFNGNHDHPPVSPASRRGMSETWIAENMEDHRDAQEFYRQRGEYITHAESAELRRAFIESKRWSAVRGDPSSWEAMGRAYEDIADAWGGGVEFRIEHYALLELQKGLGDENPVYNYYALTQDHVSRMYLSPAEVSRARELGQRYVKALWSRRIKRDVPAEVCRLRPQFASEPAPYPNPRPVLRVLELPRPPKDKKPRPLETAAPQTIRIEPRKKECGPVGPRGPLAGCLPGYH